MLKFIQNTGDYFSSNYFDEDFISKVLSKTGYNAEDVKEFNKKITPLKEKYFQYKELYIEGKLRTKDKIRETHNFHTLVLNALGYDGGHTQYNHLFHLTEDEVIPIRHILYRGDQPHLMIMEMQSLIKEDDTEPDGLFEQRYNIENEEQFNPAQKYHRLQWADVFTTPQDVKISPVIINKAVSELFLLEPHLRPKYIMLMAGNGLYLLEQEKWFRGSYLQFDLEELFSEATANRNANYYALFYFLVGKETLAPDSNMVLLDQLDEDSHKSAYEVTKDLKEGIIHAVEALANEALEYLEKTLNEDIDESDDKFEQEIKDDCLRIIYRLLFIFYAESREDLDILPSNDQIYNKGYSLEMLRDLEQVPLYSDNSLNGFFFHESISKLFNVLSSGYREKENGHNKSFKVRHIDSPIFDDRKLHHLHRVKFRNKVWQDIICRLSLSKQQRNKARGRISYANLGINQLGSVYESLLAYRGFYAEQDYIEVHKAGKPDEGTYLVPRSRRDDFKEDEILKNDNHEDVILKKGTFVYRLSGRDRQKSASYYTPEVLTQCTVKYTLKPILEKLDKGEMKALELLDLKLLEPAMGAAAFHNEMINQLAEAYVSYRQKELRDSGRKEWKIEPDKYREELQKVKAYIATHNVYGVDLNPTAIELGKLSLWLNVIHRDMETPFFSNRICVGNAVVGAWLKVYSEKDVIEEYEVVKNDKGTDKKALVKKEWWEKAPRQLEFKPNTDFEKIKTNRKQNEIYHFLLPDKNMVSSAGIKILKEENQTFAKGVGTWKKEWTKPLSKTEFERVKAISNSIDELLAEYYRFQRNINLQTGSRQNIFGAARKNEQGILEMRSYDEKEKLADQRNRHSAPYFKLKMVMDYWCSLWFWDVRQANELPNRSQYWSDIANILQLDIEKIVIQEAEKEFQEGNQQKLFYGGGEQLSIGEESEDAPKIFEEVVIEYAERKDLFDENQRLKIVGELSNRYYFFHPQLEFLEVFWERGGFDLIAGNPPWVNIEMDEGGILSEGYPEYNIRDFSAPEIRAIIEQKMKSDNVLLSDYVNEEVGVEPLKQVLASSQLYHLLSGQKNNLYKAILVNSFDLINERGLIGLIHPDGLYEDPEGEAIRSVIYRRLRYHFQFRNELTLFSEVMHTRNYSINVYGGLQNKVDFFNINNLYHPITIDESFIHNGLGLPGGLKYYDKAREKNLWNTKGHKNRVVRITEDELKMINDFNGRENSSYYSTPLIGIHSVEISNVLKVLASFKYIVRKVPNKVTDGFNETTAPKRGLILEKTGFPVEDYDLIYSGTHFFVSNPFYRTPKMVCTKTSDFEIIDLNLISESFRPRTNFVPGPDLNQFLDSTPSLDEKKWINSYKCAFNKMLDSVLERTIKPVILPPKVSHSNGAISVFFKDDKYLLGFCGLSSSIIMDFFMKTTGKGNLYDSTIQSFPLAVDEIYSNELNLRVLLLNCLSNNYSELWAQSYTELFNACKWSKFDKRLKDFSAISKTWNWHTPLRNAFERRMALVEIDVICAMGLGLTLEDLIMIYNVQFPTLQQNEDDTWYDKKGDIVFTCSKGLIGVGVDKLIWNKIKEQGEGECYEYINEKSELYRGKQFVFCAPYTKCNRIEDYKIAWKHFEKVFKNK
ncbi:MAG: hypothetical protein JST26_09780 [Bacteroidetes bacterium]|nr:hypothetical protein [Bacteroidota bacterium]